MYTIRTLFDFVTDTLWDARRLRRELGWTWWQCIVVEWYISKAWVRQQLEEPREAK